MTGQQKKKVPLFSSSRMLSEWFCCCLIIQEENKSQCNPFRVEWKSKTRGSHKPKYNWGLKLHTAFAFKKKYIMHWSEKNFSLLHNIKIYFFMVLNKNHVIFPAESYTQIRFFLSHLKHMQWIAMVNWQFKVNVECHEENCCTQGNCSSPS